MTVREAAAILHAEMISAGDPDRELSGGLATDVMSGAMARGFCGMAWLTCQANMNALAVAVMKEAACLIVTDGIRPGWDVTARARIEGVSLLATEWSAFAAAGRLYGAGLREGEGGYENA